MSGRGRRSQPITGEGQLAPVPERHLRKPIDGDGPVLIAGGGVAALEAVLTLRQRAGADLPIELLCPSERYEYRPLLVLEPFAEIEPKTIELAKFAEEHDVRLHRDKLVSVDTKGRSVGLADGAAIPYAALLVALGAQVMPGIDGAQTFSTHSDAAVLHDALERFDPDSSGTLVFAISDGRGWVLPLYELALLSREMLDERGATDTQIVIVTVEKAPLEVLGEAASYTVTRLLERSRIEVRTKARPMSVEGRRVRIKSGADLRADHVVAQPRMRGTTIEGLRQDKNGFLRIDRYCRVRRTKGVYAAGDITSGFAKQGGLAARQAEVAAGTILADLGHPIEPAWFEPQLDAVLLTGPILGRFRDSRGSEEWTPPSKIAAFRLSAYLGTREPAPQWWRPQDEPPAEIELSDRWT